MDTKELSQELVDSILNDTNQKKVNFENVMHDKLTAAFEAKKVAVANSIYSKPKE